MQLQKLDTRAKAIITTLAQSGVIVALMCGCGSSATRADGGTPSDGGTSADAREGSTPVVKTGNSRWDRRFQNESALGEGVAMNAAGDVFVLFRFSKELVLDGITVTGNAADNVGVAAFTREGQVRWAGSIIGCLPGSGMAIDGDGDTIFALNCPRQNPLWPMNTSGVVKLHAADGSLVWATKLPGDAGSASLVGTGSGAIAQGWLSGHGYTTRFDASGSIVWQQQDVLYGTVGFANGTIFAGVHFYGAATIQGKSFTTPGPLIGNVAVSAADLQGGGRFARAFTSASSVSMWSFAAGPQSLLAVGKLPPNGDTGSGPSPSYALFVQAYDLGGNPTWQHLYPQTLQERNGLACAAPAPDGDWIVTGLAQDAVDLGKGVVQNASFVVRLSPSGAPLWVQSDTTFPWFNHAAVAADGAVALIGRTGDVGTWSLVVAVREP